MRLPFSLRSVAHRSVRGTYCRTVSQRRHASFYNTDISGLTEEQEEVRLHQLVGNPLHAKYRFKFRNAVEEFAQREVAPRAAEIDRSNNFPSVLLAFHYS
jgi:isovaleryl-CoA dehydrogenase